MHSRAASDVEMSDVGGAHSQLAGDCAGEWRDALQSQERLAIWTVLLNPHRLSAPRSRLSVRAMAVVVDVGCKDEGVRKRCASNRRDGFD